MDREEYSVVVGTASSPVEAATPEGPIPEPMDRDAFHIAATEERQHPQPETGSAEAAPREESPPPAQVIEALLFSSDAPLSGPRLAELAGLKSATGIPDLIEELNGKYTNAGLTFRIEHIARGYQMLSLPSYRSWLTKLHHQRTQSRLTPAALETLAIVAYKQPVIRADVEAIRGVACGEVLNRLREMGLVRIVGRAEIVGRPMLYGTTRRFLDVFGLADLSDLPPMEALALRPVAKVEETPAHEEPDAAEPAESPLAAAGA
jgi:segregation and condensation protein B